ncbi:hypothetical protein [Methylobacterium sp. R2-1]|uniref:hypothetical protein n=1 Tax=Methylobacterium sp. R2-1 TaxID=2587064 RepID=UPI001610031B|nr:hypothetical protein [Methylobacterium sp. R2-1]MBB2961948.1 hypothetical protein [Methylobacterium sp. R2-1]
MAEADATETTAVAAAETNRHRGTRLGGPHHTATAEATASAVLGMEAAAARRRCLTLCGQKRSIANGF